MTKTLKEFLKKHNACIDGYEFAKDMTLPEFLKKCERGDWILWLFKRMNPEKIRELVLAKAHCAKTVEHLMSDERSKNAIKVAIAFGEGKASEEELNVAATAAFAAAYGAYDAATAASVAATGASTVAYTAAYAAHTDTYSASAAASYAGYAAVSKIANLKQTADICRKYLPIESWEQTVIYGRISTIWDGGVFTVHFYDEKSNYYGRYDFFPEEYSSFPSFGHQEEDRPYSPQETISVEAAVRRKSQNASYDQIFEKVTLFFPDRAEPFVMKPVKK